jgi:hypothetical protein
MNAQIQFAVCELCSDVVACVLKCLHGLGVRGGVCMWLSDALQVGQALKGVSVGAGCDARLLCWASQAWHFVCCSVGAACKHGALLAVSAKSECQLSVHVWALCHENVLSFSPVHAVEHQGGGGALLALLAV